MIINNFKKRIVVTGGNGFIGHSVVKELLINEHYEVVIVDKIKKNIDGVVQYIGDFSDEKLLAQVIKKNDIVIHLACSTIPSLSEDNKSIDVRENVIGSLSLLEICKDVGVNKFIFFSSGGTVYGDLNSLAKESYKTEPINAHGAMKLSIENYIKVYSSMFGLDYLILRVSNPYGREINAGKSQGVVDVILDKVYKNEAINIWGDGSTVRDFIYIDDLVSFVMKGVADVDIKNHVFNVGTGTGTSINEIIDIIKKLSRKDVNVIYESDRKFDLAYNVLDVDNARKILNWNPVISITTGIKRIIDTYESK